jgi:hypothetical protein
MFVFFRSLTIYCHFKAGRCGFAGRYESKINDCPVSNFSKFYLKGDAMKNLIKLVMIAVVGLLISSAAYAGKGDGERKADRESQKAAAAASKQTQDTAKEAKEDKGKAEEKAAKVRKEHEDKVKDANAMGEKKKSEHRRWFGFGRGKDHQQQLKALDEKSVKVQAKNTEKIAALEKELASAQAAKDMKKAEKLEKKLAHAKQKAEDEMKKNEAKRTKIQEEMAKEK